MNMGYGEEEVDRGGIEGGRPGGGGQVGDVTSSP